MEHARRRPVRLAEKLLQIRTALNLSQTEMHRRLDVGDEIPSTRISDYELDKSEPTLMILLSYARLAAVPTEVLIDDDLKLPAKLPGPTNHEELRRQFSPRNRKR